MTVRRQVVVSTVATRAAKDDPDHRCQQGHAASPHRQKALLADLGVCELFDRRFGGGVYVSAGADYIDARVPGLQAAYERTYTTMAIASFTSTYFGGQRFFMGGDGTLDAGRIFSPVQFIIGK